MKYRIKNAEIYADGKFTRGSVLIDGEKIVRVGEDKTFAADRAIDFSGDILLPAFVNAHTHSAMTLFRGIGDGLPLERWLREGIFPLEKLLTPEDVYWGSMLAVLEYAGGGTALCGDMYFHPETLLEVAKRTGFGFVATGGATDFGGQADESAAAEEERYLRLNGVIPNFRYLPGAHSEYLTTDALIDNLVRLSAKYAAPLYCHMSETLNEVGECTVRHNGLTPPLYLHRMGFFDRGASVAHGVHLDKDDMDVLAQSGVSVVSNPASNLKLASGVAPLAALTKRGVNVALGTDGAASNNALDMFREMYLASVLQKCELKDAAAIPSETAIAMATRNGAAALFAERTGEIREGFEASLMRVSLKAPRMRPKNSLAGHIVYAANASDVAMTMCRGKILYENGEYYIGEQPEEIYRRAEGCVARLLRAAERGSC